ncbi:MAG: hypothetical protein EBZ13_15010, partial [Planctomycetia bacterium]|nr:hypothetical protein [Planctomycetia bacterium]
MPSQPHSSAIGKPLRDGDADRLASAIPLNPHLGGTLGRYANRIARGRISIDGVEHRLDVNKDGNTLHGGRRGFDRQVWKIIELVDDDDLATITFELTSPDGDMGFPGTVTAQ